MERIARQAGDEVLVMEAVSGEVGRLEGSLISPAASSISAVVILKVKVSHALCHDDTLQEG